jgi:O-antigen ligase
LNEDKAYAVFSVLTKIGLGGVVFFIPISNALLDSFACLALLGFIGKKIVKPDFQWLKHKQNIFLALFFFFMGISLINSGQYINKSVVALFLKWGKYVGLSLILQDSINKRKDILIFVGIFLFSSTLVAISGITQLFWGVEFLRGREIAIMKGGVRAITSSFSHPNGFGAYLIIPFTLCVAFLKVPRLFKASVYSSILFLAIILAFCIFHTYSRGTWLGVLAALMLMLSISRRLVVISILFIFTGVLLLVPVFREILFSIFRFGGDADRFKYWQAAIAMFKENPFLGKGLGTFMANFSRYLPQKLISYAHNCFLQILAESGIFSLIAFLGFVCSVLYAGIKKFFSAKNPILLGGVCGLSGFLVHSLFEVSLYSLPLAVLFWLWIGMVTVLSNSNPVDVK